MNHSGRLAWFIGCIAIVMVCFGVVGLTFAEEFVFQNGLNQYQGAKDNSIYEDGPDSTNGKGKWIFSGPTATSFRRALIQFDLSALPPNGLVTQVELMLRVDRSGSSASPTDAYRVYRLLKDWGEGTRAAQEGGFGVAAGAGDATWVSNLFSQSMWDQPGGDYVVDDDHTPTLVASNPGDTVIFSTAGMANDVQFWLENPSQNFGWIIIGDEAKRQTARRFDSSDADAQTNRPRLAIQIEPASPVDRWELY